LIINLLGKIYTYSSEISIEDLKEIVKVVDAIFYELFGKSEKPGKIINA
jgi:hypothetical protein